MIDAPASGINLDWTGTPVAHHNSGPGSYPAVFGQTGHQDASQPGSFGSGLVGMGVPAQAKGMNAVSKRIQAKGQGMHNGRVAGCWCAF